MLHRIAYISTASHLFSKTELEDLLKISIENNSKENITGLLLTKGITFIQCIEGENNAVHKLYEKIKRDDRHYNIYTLIDEKVDERIFPNWTMGYKNFENIMNLESSTVKELNLEDVKAIKKDEVYKIFELALV